MADLTEAYSALQKADAAGDTAGAKQLADYIRSQSSSTAPAAPASKPLGFSDYAAAIPEAAAYVGSGALSSILGGLSSAGTEMGNAGNWALNKLGMNVGPAGDSAANMRQIQQDMTYQPRTAGGQTLVRALSYPGQKFSQFANYAGGKTAELTGSPAAGAAVNTGIQALPYAVGAKFASDAPVISSAPKTLAPEVAEATNAGFKLTPEQAGGLTGKIVQGLSGSAKLERSVSKQNIPLANMLIKQQLGMADAAPLTRATLQEAKAAPNSVYAQVSKLGAIPTDAQYTQAIAGIANRSGEGSFAFDVPKSISELKDNYAGIKSFDAADAVAKVRQLRRDSSANLSARNAPEQNALGHAQRQIAEALDDQIDRFAQQAGSPDLVSQLRGARQQLAQINSAQAAVKGSNVVPARLARQLDKGVPLSGNLRVIANAATNFDRSFQDLSKIRDSNPFGVLDLGFGAAAGLVHPAALSAVLARPLARAALTSNAYQRLGIRGAPITGPSAQNLALLGAPPLTQGLLEQQSPP